MALGSIVDYLKQSGKDSSYSGRKKMAEQYGIGNYSGTAAQNSALLNMLQKESGSNKGVPENVTAGGMQNQNQTLVPLAVSSGAGGAAPSPQSGYNRSDRVNEYYDKVQNMENDTPDAFDSRYEGEISDILDNIMNRPAFSYTSKDLMSDDLYQMYRENYMKQGDMAMRDAMGNASSLSGGYGNTYASAAGQQAYDNYLGALNDKALDFADRAYDRYRDDTADNYNQLAAVQGLDNTDYARYRDDMNDYYTNRDYMNNRYNQEYNYDYGQYQNQVSQQQWAQEFAFQQQQAAQEQARWAAEMAASAAKSSGGGSGRKSSGGSSSSKAAGETKKLSVNEAVSILDNINRREGANAAAAEAQRLISGGQLAYEKGDLTSEQRIARMVDQWQYQAKKNKSKK